MQKPELRSVYRLSEHEVDQLVADVRSADAGVKTFYTVDSHEVVDFCFPIDSENMHRSDPNQIADDQAALYEIFYNRQPPPILIPDYEKELRRHLTYLTVRAEDVYRTIKEIDELLGGKPLDDIRSLSRDLILEKMEEQFNNLLAVVMGIYSMGVERFRSVIDTRLQRVSNIDDPKIRDAAAAYQTSPLAEEIYNDLIKDIDSEKWSEAELFRKRRAAETDARAVDWLIYMNQRLRHAGYSMLYLSSAHKTKRIFSSPAVRNALERENQHDRPLYRSRAQMLALIISTEPDADSAAIIENLKDLKNIIAELKPVKQQRIASCQVCVLHGGTPDACDFLAVCQKMNVLETRRESIQNMGLLGRIHDYEELLNARPKSANHREYLEYFRRLMETENLGDLAIARMKAALSLALTEGQIEPAGDADATATGGRTPAAAPSHFLPIEPRLENPVHQEIVKKIFEYPEMAARDHKQALLRLHSAVETFERIDRNTERTDPQHELVRCLIYMAERETTRDSARGDANALQYAKKMAEQHPELRAEFLYVILWTARRLERYQEAHNAAKQGILEFPNDARLYHGRSVNTICWLDSEKQKQYCPMKRSDAIADAQRALELYSRDDADRSILKAVQLNNIAWLRCCDENSRDYKLREARKALDQLKEILPASAWLPSFAEFFHTEAYLEYEEFKAAKNGGQRGAVLLEKLERARKAVDQAMAVPGNDDCIPLRRSIDQAMKHLTGSRTHGRSVSSKL